MLSRISKHIIRSLPLLSSVAVSSYHSGEECCCDEEIYCCCSCGCDTCTCGPPKTMIGAHAPDFSAEALMANGTFGAVELHDYVGKWLCLNFYPLDFTFVCPTEILAFSDRVEDFANLDCEVLMASVDSKFSHFAWTQVPRNEGGLGNVQIPLVSDISKTISRDYGVLKRDAGIAFRGTFLIDPDSNLRQIIINDLPIGRNVDDVLRLLEACQYFDENGEVCPANWNKGDDTIDVTDPGKYFSKQ